MCCSVRCYMGFSTKLLMDSVLLLVLMPALITANAVTPTMVTSNSTPCNCTLSMPTISPPCTVPTPEKVIPPSIIGRIRVKWNQPCQGTIYFFKDFTQDIHLCKNTFMNHKLGKELCEERKCEKFVKFHDTNSTNQGFNLTSSSNNSCSRISIICKEIPEKVNKELVTYKVITGLLLTLIIFVLLCRFAQPAYIAVHDRFSQKRESRWVGPTQSQSVSYHRGQASHPNNNTTKRHSYPGLERLTVYPSREPSSNRNSDYDSYGV